MVRIAGVLLPQEKRIEAGLTYIYGIGPTLAKKTLQALAINPDTRVKAITPTQEKQIAQYIDQSFTVEGQLRSRITQDIRRLKDINAYRGLRHSRNLPVRGQRTRTNARTKRGKRVTVGSARKKTAEKT